MKVISFGTGEWLHECWLEEQKASVNVSRVTEWQNVGLYEGFVTGVVSGLRLNQPPFSMPENVTNGEVFKVVGKFLERHPNEWGKSAAVLVVKALRATWPPPAGIGTAERIGERLVRMGVMKPEQVERVLAAQQAGDSRMFGQIALALGFVEDNSLRRYADSLDAFKGDRF